MRKQRLKESPRMALLGFQTSNMTHNWVFQGRPQEELGLLLPRGSNKALQPSPDWSSIRGNLIKPKI